MTARGHEGGEECKVGPGRDVRFVRVPRPQDEIARHGRGGGGGMEHDSGWLGGLWEGIGYQKGTQEEHCSCS